jgi:hypothetical protein
MKNRVVSIYECKKNFQRRGHEIKLFQNKLTKELDISTYDRVISDDT